MIPSVSRIFCLELRSCLEDVLWPVAAEPARESSAELDLVSKM